MEQKIRVRRHKKTDRLYVDLNGFLNVDDLNLFKDKMTRALEKVIPPFGMIANQKTLQPIGGDAHRIAIEVMKMVSEKGCKKVVRIVGENALLKLRQDEVDQNEDFNYEVIHATSIKMAEHILEKEGL